MRQTILGRKLGMTQIFDRQGNAIPVTIVQAGPCTVLQIKTAEKEGYNAIQLGFGDKKEKHTTRPLMGHFNKADSTPKRHIREAEIDDPGMFKVGQVITAGLFEKDDHVDITGTSKGKGFAGVMKRHGFAGFMATHGVHESKRGPGSIGQSADPAKTFKGMKMPGQMGNETVTVQNLRIMDVRESQNLILVKGPVPGGKNGLLVIHHSVKKDAPPVRQTEPEEDELSPDLAVNGIEGETAAEEAAAKAAPEGETPGKEDPEEADGAASEADSEDHPEPEKDPEPDPEAAPSDEAEVKEQTAETAETGEAAADADVTAEAAKDDAGPETEPVPEAGADASEEKKEG